MIPDLPSSVGPSEKIEFFEKLASRLDGQSGVHVMWHTHKRDPSVCWICDTQILTYRVLEVAKELLLSPPLDIETDLDSESENESEINTEYDEGSMNDIENYNEPEYDVEDNEH